MGLNVPLKIQAIVTLVDAHTLRCEIDTTKVPSTKLAIAMLEQAVRVMRNEEANQEAALFGKRIMEEQVEAALQQAIASGKKLQ